MIPGRWPECFSVSLSIPHTTTETSASIQTDTRIDKLRVRSGPNARHRQTVLPRVRPSATRPLRCVGMVGDITDAFPNCATHRLDGGS